MVDNDASKTKCVACKTPKPGAKPPVLSSKPAVNIDKDLMKKFAPPADSWDCDTCMVQNTSTDNACVACQTPKPGATKTATTTTTMPPSFGISSNITPDSSLVAKFAPPAGSWTCDTCMVDNKSEDSACVACQTPKPGAMPGASTTTGFKFGGGQTFVSSPFKFGLNNSVDANSSTVSSVKFGFGSSVETKTKAESSSSASLKLAVNTDQNSKNDSKQEEGTTKLLTFLFGASSSQSTDSDEAKTNAPSFTFGANNQSGKDDSNKPSFSFGANSSVDKDKPISGGCTFGDNKATPEPANKGNNY